jgi:ketosteroid isomerase-like protein
MRTCVAALLAIVAAVEIVEIVAIGQPRKTDDALEKLRTEFASAFNARDAARVASFYAEDATMMPPNEPMIRGRTDIEASYRKTFANNIGTIALQSIESEASGQWGFQAGTWTLSSGGAAAVGGAVIVTESPRATVGKNMVIYKRAGNGWKMAYDIWNDDASPGK